ncbi:MAG: glycoside hydrolase family 16 protein [Asticcacaulis sp.]
MQRLKRAAWLGLGTMALMTGAGCAQDAPSGYHLVWADEFNTPGMPDPAKWSYDTWRNHDGWWNHEAEYYSNARPENSRVEDGKLIIEARKDDVSAMPDYGGQKYSSARLVTLGHAKWTYGFFDIRARFTCGKGQWPAIWMLGDGQWPGTGEIDIMEQVGFQPTTVWGSLHSIYTVEDKKDEGDKLDIADLCNAFHDYQLDWRRDGITFLVDGKPYYHMKRPAQDDQRHWPFDGPQYLILNMAIGGDWGGQQGIDDSALPARMEVDYVRVYQRD